MLHQSQTMMAVKRKKMKISLWYHLKDFTGPVRFSWKVHRLLPALNCCAISPPNFQHEVQMSNGLPCLQGFHWLSLVIFPQQHLLIENEWDQTLNLKPSTEYRNNISFQ